MTRSPAAKSLSFPFAAAVAEPPDRRLEVGEEVISESQTTSHIDVLPEPGGDVVDQLSKGFPLDDMAVVGARRDDQPSVLVARRVLLAALVPDLDEHEVRVLGLVAVP